MAYIDITIFVTPQDAMTIVGHHPFGGVDMPYDAKTDWVEAWLIL